MDQRTLSMRLAVITHKLADVSHQVLMDEDVEDAALGNAVALLSDVATLATELRASITNHRAVVSTRRGSPRRLGETNG